MLKRSVLFTAIIALQALPAQAIQMFENSPRREPVSIEGKGILKLNYKFADGRRSHCTAFFVKNKGDRPLIATARHCAEYDIAKACEDKRISFTTQWGQFVGTCKSVVAGTAALDTIVLEGSFDQWDQVKKTIEFYSLSSQRPQINTRLEMMGYPGDPERRGKFSVTDNCWISDRRAATWTDYNSSEEERLTAETELARARAQPRNPLAAAITKNYAAFHNCSVYGGNSGGPILIENSRIVLGLPSAYYPNLFRPLSEDLSSQMSSMSDFVAINKAKLDELGVITAAPYADQVVLSPYVLLEAQDGNWYCSKSSEGVDAAPAFSQDCQ